MKRTGRPALRLKPTLLRRAKAVLGEGESLSEFVATSLSNAVAWRTAQDNFLARSAAAIERSVRAGSGMGVEELLKRMDDRIASAQSAALEEVISRPLSENAAIQALLSSKSPWER